MTNEDLASRLKTFALILKFGHDLFSARNYAAAAAQSVNDCMALLNFKSSVLFEFQGGEGTVIGQSGQTAVNPHSQLVLLQKQLAESLDFKETAITATSDMGIVPELFQAGNTFLCLKLSLPAAEKSGVFFVWLLEYEAEIPPGVHNTAKLLGTSVAEALYFHKFSPRNMWKSKKTLSAMIRWSVIILCLTALMLIPVPESTSADFVLKAPDITAAYAPFDGTIRHCLKQSGVSVRKGEVIAAYDTELLTYRMRMAESAAREVETELLLEQQNAFTDQEKLGKVKLLEARLATLLVAVKEAKWYLDHAQIKAPADGVLILTDGKAELLTGKMLRIGEKLFEIHGGKGMAAEVTVNEENSSILQKNFSLSLYLHTAPDKQLSAKVLEISSYPELTGQRIFCYKVSAELDSVEQDFRYGMRGIAKLSGAEVSLGYAIAKRMILWFRSL